VEIIGSNGSDQPASIVQMNSEYWKYFEILLVPEVDVWGLIQKGTRIEKEGEQKQFSPREYDNINLSTKCIPKRLNFPLKMH
jgi:hypothetical protein